MAQSEIDDIRALLSSKPRPIGWAQRRQRLDDVGAHWPVADDVTLDAADLDGVPGEWSIVPGSDASCILMFFHGGGYCSGSILSHRRMVTEAGRAAGMRTLAVGYRLAPEHPFPAALDDALTAWRFVRKQGIAAGAMAIGGDSAGGGLTVGVDPTPARRRRGASRLRVAGIALDRPDHFGFDARHQRCDRSDSSTKHTCASSPRPIFLPGWTGKIHGSHPSMPICQGCRQC